MAVVSSLLAIFPLQFVGVMADSLIQSNITVSGARDAKWLWTLLKSTPFLANETGFTLALYALITFLLTSILAHLVRTIFGYLATIFADTIIVSIRTALFAKVLTLSAKFFYNTPKGTIIYKIMNDTQNLENIYSHPLYTLFSDLLDLAWITLFLFLIDPLLVLILFPPIPILYLFSLRTGKTQRSILTDLREEESRMSTRIEQTLANIETVKAFGGETREQELFLKTSQASLSHRIKSARGLSVFFPIEGTLRIVGISALLLYALYKVNQGVYTVGLIPVIYLYGTRFYTPITNLSRYYQTIQRGVTSAKRILELLDEPQETKEFRLSPKIEPRQLGSLFVERVKVVLDDRTVLENFELNCEPGQFILIRGPSGSGKSTFLKTLLGFHDKDGGNIFVSGANIEDYSFDDLRQQFSYASQESHLHDISLLENVIYPSSPAEISKDETLNAKDLLMQLGFRTPQIDKNAGEGGQLLSGGERRRATLARAVLRQSPILLLDEITANLDQENENLILSLLSKIKGQRSIVVISHSVNPVLEKLADHTVVLAI